MKSVEIEFLMRDKVSPGMENVGETAMSAGEKVENASRRMKEKIAEQKQVIKQVEADLKSLEKQYARMGPGRAQSDMIAEIKACKKVLEEERGALIGLELDVEETTEKHRSLRQEIKLLKDQMATMTEGTDEYADAMQRLGDLQDRMGDINQQGMVMADDEKNFKAATEAVNLFTGAVTTGMGIVSLFGVEEEKLAKIQTRLQSIMAISMGMTQMATALNKDSYLRIVILSKGKDMLSTATTRLSVALGISNTAAKALLATLTVGLSVAIGVVITLWDKFSSSQKKAREELMKFNEATVSSVADMRSSYEKLRQEWLKTNGVLEDQEKFLQKNREELSKFPAEINSISDAELAFKEKTDEFIRAMDLRAKATAAFEIASEKYKEALLAMSKAEADANTVDWRDKLYGALSFGLSAEDFHEQRKNKKLEKGAAKESELNAEANDWLLKSMGFDDESIQVFKDAGFKAQGEIFAYSQSWYQNQLSKQQDILKRYSPDSSEYKTALAEEARIKKELEKFNTSDKGKDTKIMNTLADAELKARQRIEDQTITLMEEGYEKQRKTASLNFEREKERINKEEADRLTLYAKLKAAGENVSEEDRQKIIAQAVALRVQAASLYDQALAGIDDKAKKEESERIDKLLAPYKDFAARRVDIEKQYQKDIEALQAIRTDDNADEIDRAIEQAKKNRAQEYENLDREISESAQRSSKILEAIFANAGEQSKSKITETIAEAEKLLKVLQGEESGESIGFTSEQVEAMQKDSALIQDLIQAIIDKKDALYDRGGSVSRFVGSFKQIREALEMDDAEKRMEGLGKGIDNMIGSGKELCDVFSGFADDLASIAELSGSNTLGSIAEGMQGIANVAGSMLSGAETGMAVGGVWGAAIGAVIGGVTSVLSMATEANARHKQALQEIEEAKIAYQRKYNLLLLEQKLLMEEASNIFGEQSIAKAARALEVYREAIEKYKETLKGDAPTKNFIETITNDAYRTYAQKMADYEKGIGALSSAEIVTGHKKTGLFGWGKGKDTYSGLLDVYKDLVDENGRLDTAMAESILSTQKMDDSTRELIQSLIDLQEQADEAQEQLRDYLQSTFGSLGDGIMDSITDAIINGGNDAWETFGKSGAAVLENLGKQLTYSLFFAKQFDKLQADLEKIYGSGKSEQEIANDAMNLLGDFYSGIGGQMDMAQDFMEEWQKKAAEQGFDLWAGDGTTQNARAGGVQTITQEAGNRIEGILTSMQSHSVSIDDKLDKISDGLYLITEAIFIIRDHCARLEAIELLMIKIERDGLKVR